MLFRSEELKSAIMEKKKMLRDKPDNANAGKVRNKKQPEQKVVVEETPLPETTSESVISESEAEKPGEAVSKSESEPDDENVAEDETVTP